METSPLWQESELCLAPMAFKQGTIFIVPHLAVALGLGLSGLVHRTAPHSVALYDPVRVLMAFGLILIRVITWQSGYLRKYTCKLNSI